MVHQISSVARAIASFIASDARGVSQFVCGAFSELRFMMRASKSGSSTSSSAAAPRLLFVFIALLCVISTLAYGSHISGSVCLQNFCYLLLLDAYSLALRLLDIWIQIRRASPSHSQVTSSYTFGFARFQVLGTFTSAILVLLSSFFICKEACELLIGAQHEEGGGAAPLITHSSASATSPSSSRAVCDAPLTAECSSSSTSSPINCPAISSLFFESLRSFSSKSPATRNVVSLQPIGFLLSSANQMS